MVTGLAFADMKLVNSQEKGHSSCRLVSRTIRRLCKCFKLPLRLSHVALMVSDTCISFRPFVRRELRQHRQRFILFSTYKLLLSPGLESSWTKIRFCGLSMVFGVPLTPNPDCPPHISFVLTFIRMLPTSTFVTRFPHPKETTKTMQNTYWNGSVPQQNGSEVDGSTFEDSSFSDDSQALTPRPSLYTEHTSLGATQGIFFPTLSVMPSSTPSGGSYNAGATLTDKLCQMAAQRSLHGEPAYKSSFKKSCTFCERRASVEGRVRSVADTIISDDLKEKLNDLASSLRYLFDKHRHIRNEDGMLDPERWNYESEVSGEGSLLNSVYGDLCEAKTLLSNQPLHHHNHGWGKTHDLEQFDELIQTVLTVNNDLFWLKARAKELNLSREKIRAEDLQNSRANQLVLPTRSASGDTAMQYR